MNTLKYQLVLLCMFFAGCNMINQENKIAALLKMAETTDSLQHYHESIEIYTDILKLDSTRYRALINRAHAFVFLGQLKQGFADYDKYIQMHPSARSYFTRGMAFGDLKRNKEAGADLHKSISMDTAFGEALYGLSMIKVDENDLDSARYYCTLADRISYYQGYNFYIWYTIFEKTGDYESAVAIMSKAITRDPGNGVYYNNRGYSKIHLRKYEEALEDLDSSLVLYPHFSYALNNKAEAWLHLNRTDSALSYVNRSLALSNKNPFAWKNRGEIYLALKNKNEACKDLNQALLLSKDSQLTALVLSLKKENCD